MISVVGGSLEVSWLYEPPELAHCLTHAAITAELKGLATCAFMPAARHMSMSAWRVDAVSATIGTHEREGSGRLRMSLAASNCRKWSAHRIARALPARFTRLHAPRP